MEKISWIAENDGNCKMHAWFCVKRNRGAKMSGQAERTWAAGRAAAEPSVEGYPFLAPTFRSQEGKRAPESEAVLVWDRPRRRVLLLVRKHSGSAPSAGMLHPNHQFNCSSAIFLRRGAIAKCSGPC